MECRVKTNISSRCNCAYEPCARKGICCECLAYHLRQGELPACAFPPEIERTFDRSFERFAAWVGERKEQRTLQVSDVFPEADKR